MIEMNRQQQQTPPAADKDPVAMTSEGRQQQQQCDQAAVWAAVLAGTDRKRGDSMTQRDRPGSQGSEARPPRGPAPASLPPTFAACSESFWERWYAHASAEQRQQVIELAQQQGVLCSTQLPPSESPAKKSVVAELLANPSAARD